MVTEAVVQLRYIQEQNESTLISKIQKRMASNRRDNVESTLSSSGRWVAYSESLHEAEQRLCRTLRLILVHSMTGLQPTYLSM